MEQLELDGMPEPVFSTSGYDVDAITNAQRKVDEAKALVAEHPDLMGEAARMAADEAAQRGHVGVRWLGEMLRLWLHDDGADDPHLCGFFDLRPCALDAVMGTRA